MRIFQVSTHPGKEKEFGEFFHKTAIPLMKRTEGLVSVLPGAARPESPTEFSFVMIWKDLDALRAFVGENYENPHIDSAEAELVNPAAASSWPRKNSRNVVAACARLLSTAGYQTAVTSVRLVPE